MSQDSSLDALKRSWRNELQKLHATWIAAEQKRRLTWLQDKNAEILRLQHEHQTESSAMLDSCRDERLRAELSAAADQHMKGLQALLDQVSLPALHEEAPAVVYVLQCEHDKFYVGRCLQKRQAARMQEHRGTKSNIQDLLQGSEWTRRHPVVRVLEATPCWDYLQENMTVLQWMRDKGIDHVRGGPWPSEYLSGHQRAEIERQLDNATDSCFHCHSTSHFAAECPSKTHRRHRMPPRPAAGAASATSCPPSPRLVEPAALSATAAAAAAATVGADVPPPPSAATPPKVHPAAAGAAAPTHELHTASLPPSPEPSTAAAAAAVAAAALPPTPAAQPTTTPHNSFVTPSHLLPSSAATPLPTPPYKPCGRSSVVCSFSSSTQQTAPQASTITDDGASIVATVAPPPPPPPHASPPVQPPQPPPQAQLDAATSAAAAPLPPPQSSPPELPPQRQQQAQLDAATSAAAAAAAAPPPPPPATPPPPASAAAAATDVDIGGPSHCTTSNNVATQSPSGARKRGRELSAACGAQADPPAWLCTRLAQLSTGLSEEEHISSTAAAAGGRSSRGPEQPGATTSSHRSAHNNNNYACAGTVLRASCNASPTRPSLAPHQAQGHACGPTSPLTSGSFGSASSGPGLPADVSACPPLAAPAVLQPWGSSWGEGGGGATACPSWQAQPSLLPAHQPATPAPQEAQPPPLCTPLQHSAETMQQAKQPPAQAAVWAPTPPPCPRCGRTGHKMLYDSRENLYMYDCWSKSHCVTQQQLLPVGHFKVPLLL